MSKELDTPTAALPALGYNPAADITAGDIPTPRIKLAQMKNVADSDGVLKIGDIFTMEGADIVPITVPVRFYLLDAFKGRQYKDTNNDVQRIQKGEPDPDLSLVLEGKPWNIYDTTDFTIAVPSVDQLLPFKLFLANRSSGRQARKLLNLHILKSSAAGEDFRLTPFELSTTVERNSEGTWATAVVRLANAPAAEVQKELEAVATIAGNVSAAPTPTERPQIKAPALD